MTTDDTYCERGINLPHGLVAAEKLGPFDLILEATGYWLLVFEAAHALAVNGILILSSVKGEEICSISDVTSAAIYPSLNGASGWSPMASVATLRALSLAC